MEIEQNNMVQIKNKSIWRWFKWILLGIGILVIVLIILILIFRPKEKDLANISIPAFSDPLCTRNFEPQHSTEPYYKGPLFDTHFHIPPDHKNFFVRKDFPILQKEITLTEIVCELEKEKVVGAITFYAPSSMLMFSMRSDNQMYQQWADQAKEIKNGSPSWFHILYAPIFGKKEEAVKAFETNSGTFEGFGEMVYLSGGSPRSGAEVDDEISQATLNYANNNKLVIMVHPEESDKNHLENALKQNPNAIFLLHGWGHDDYIMELMNKYPNFYFTLDAPTLFYQANRYIEGPGDKYVAEIKKDFTADIDRAVNQWGQQIERHPDRYLWGTDRSERFQYTEELGKLYEEEARAFLGRLNPSYQEMVAYKNAQDIFEKGLQPQIKQSNQNQSNQGLGDLPESARNCIIGKVGEDSWNKLNNHEKPATEQERKIIDECSK